MRYAPNILTISRIVLAILLLVIMVHWEQIVPSWVHISWRDYFACVVFGIASITDFFDGYIARKFNVSSTFGEVFDPLADKMLILSAFIGLLLVDRANPWAVFLILSREFYITGLRIVAVTSHQNVAATSLGKYKTGLQILAIAFLLIDYFPGGTFLLWLAVFVTLYSGLDYTFKYYKAVKE